MVESFVRKRNRQCLQHCLPSHMTYATKLRFQKDGLLTSHHRTSPLCRCPIHHRRYLPTTHYAACCPFSLVSTPNTLRRISLTVRRQVTSYPAPPPIPVCRGAGSCCAGRRRSPRSRCSRPPYHSRATAPGSHSREPRERGTPAYAAWPWPPSSLWWLRRAPPDDSEGKTGMSNSVWYIFCGELMCSE